MSSSKWQRIETAPKDGTPILAFKPNERRSGSWTAAVYWDDTNHRSGWVFVGGREAECPSHWMPLPEPPND